MNADYPFPEPYSEEPDDADTLARAWAYPTQRLGPQPVYDYDDSAQTPTVKAPTAAIAPWVREAWAPTVAAPTVAMRASPKSPFLACVLQVLWPGTGRWYLGYNSVAAWQIGLWILGAVTAFGFIGLPILVGIHVTCLIDGIALLSSSDPHYCLDGRGRRMRRSRSGRSASPANR